MNHMMLIYMYNNGSLRGLESMCVKGASYYGMKMNFIHEILTVHMIFMHKLVNALVYFKTAVSFIFENGLRD